MSISHSSDSASGPQIPASGGRLAVALRVVICCAAGLTGITVRLLGVHLDPLPALLLFGGAVLSAAFLLAWAAEALQMDVSRGLAMAVLAFIAVLPEYAVDLYFAWTAASDPTYAQYAAANMTGSNRLLIGVGWSVVALVGFYALRRRRRVTGEAAPVVPEPAVELSPGHSVDLVVLALATIWSLLMPLMRRITIWHGAGLLLLFGFYIWRVSGGAEEEPDLAGVARALGGLPRVRRRLAVGTLLGLAGGVLLCSAAPFAESLIGTGLVLGIDRFLLVQWLAPLASEAPELLVATLFASRCHGAAGLSALLSSKVNQWTLLVGTLPMVYSAGLGHVGALPLDSRQVEEFVLTAAQGMLGVSFLSNGRLYRWEALALLVLFLIQLPFPQTPVRYGFSALYAVLSLILLLRDRRFLPGHVRVALSKDSPEQEEHAQP